MAYNIVTFSLLTVLPEVRKLRNMKRDEPKELTIQEFADELHISHDMVTRWLHAGKIKGRRKNPLAKQSAFLIPVSELERVKKLMGETSEDGLVGKA